MSISKALSMAAAIMVGLLPYPTQGQDQDIPICKRYPLTLILPNNTFFEEIDIGSCSGLCKQVLSPSPAPKRVCSKKTIVTQLFRYKKIARCDCMIGKTFPRQSRRELQTNEDNEQHESDPFNRASKLCGAYSNSEVIGEDASGNEIIIDTGQCMGECKQVPGSRGLEVEINLTADDTIDELYIDGSDETAQMDDPGLWTRIDSVTKSVPRYPALGHVIAVKARDVASVVNGFLASIKYDGTIQHLTGSGEWISTSSPPSVIDGKQWYEPGYDSSAWGVAHTCLPISVNTWGTYWPAPLYTDGAQWIWGPDTTCVASWQNPTPDAWFLLKFRAEYQKECKPTAMSIGEVKIDVVKDCECRCGGDPKECPGNFEWNEYTCDCQCPLTLQSCPDGTSLNREKCLCENCGCNAKEKKECLTQQCLYTFYPFNEPGQGKAGKCAWRDFDGDGRSVCGCPQNNCQQSKNQKKEKKCIDQLCDGGTATSKAKKCQFNPRRPKGSQCDCPGIWA